MNKTVNVLYFARIREAVETEKESLEISAETQTVGDLLNLLVSRGEPWVSALSSSQLLIAVNQEMTNVNTTIADGDEVAFFPPVTGG